MDTQREFWNEIQRARHIELAAVQKRRKAEIDEETYWLAICRSRRLEIAAIERWQLGYEGVAA